MIFAHPSEASKNVLIPKAEVKCVDKIPFPKLLETRRDAGEVAPNVPLYTRADAKNFDPITATETCENVVHTYGD